MRFAFNPLSPIIHSRKLPAVTLGMHEPQPEVALHVTEIFSQQVRENRRPGRDLVNVLGDGRRFQQGSFEPQEALDIPNP